MKKTELKIGDTVRCIDDSHSFGKLRQGNTYTIEKGWHGGPVVIVNGATYNLDRFIKYDNIKNEEAEHVNNVE